MSHDHEHFLNEAWKKDEEIVKTIVANNSLQEIYQTITYREKMTPVSGGILEIVCMDGRVDETEKDGSMFVRDGGSGILRKDESIEKIADGYIQAAMEPGIETIRLTSHGDCGAWTLSGKDKNECEKFYDDLRESIAKKIEAAGLPIEVILDYIPNIEHDKEGKGLCLPHTERAAYYANVPSFNPQAVFGLPTGFVISRKYFESHYAIANAAIAVKIAFGGHGFGERFTKEQPFLLVGIVDDEKKSDEIKKELEQAKKVAIEKYLQNVAGVENRIIIIGL